MHLSINGKRNIIRQVYQQLRERILDGRLDSGERLPSSRELAAVLGVARKTITNVYDLLMSEGFLDTRKGSGTYVARGIKNRKAADPSRASRINVPEKWDNFPVLRTWDRSQLRFDFNVGVPDVSQFPFALWRSVVGSRARVLSRNADAYADPQGQESLRQAIAKHTGFTRAVVCTAPDVVVTSGAQQAFDLISKVLLESGSVVAMEHPGYERARSLFESHGAQIAEVPVDQEGLIVEQLPPTARIVYVTPSHQFPLGVSMSLRRRLALLDWASKNCAAVIEDDYDSEFRFADRPLDSLQSLDRNGVVIYVGTFSKSMFPGVRIGFVVAPEPVRTALIAARQITDWHGSVLAESTLTRFIDDGHLARHIRKMRSIYANRRKILTTFLTTELADRVRMWPGTAGLHVAVELTHSTSREIAEAARAEGLGVATFGDRGLAFGYGSIDAAKIVDGVGLLKQIIMR